MKSWSINRRTLGNAGFQRYFSRNNTPETIHNCSVVYCFVDSCGCLWNKVIVVKKDTEML
jgi:hypothetical protein